jgi:dGTPase
MLSRLRFDTEQTAGRRYPELPHPYRSEFQRDRDRIIHSRAFRRLEDKTQVFPAGFSDHFRNRLTHTIEVSQIARTVAAVLGLNGDLTEALALVHDIGHPPYAHAGEEELDRQMQRFGERFDHNHHALRIVERFEHRYPRFPGLNLTFEVREGIVKHSSDLTPGDAELAEYLPHQRPPLEAQLIDHCDEIAYNTADLDDAYAAGLLDPETLRRDVPVFAQLLDAAEMQFPGAVEALRMHEVVRGLVDHLASGLIRGTIEACDGIHTVDDVRNAPARLARYTSEAAATNQQLKTVLRTHVYNSEMVVEERRCSTARVAELFDYLLDHPEAMPTDYLEHTNDLPRHRVVCDYIAGMTDGYLNRSYRLFVQPGVDDE